MTRHRSWIITGASRGLGRALALAAAGAGDRVLAVVRTPGTAPEAAGIVEHRHDLSGSGSGSRSGAEEVVAAACEAFGGVDVLVNAAGVGAVGAVEEVDDALLEEMLRVGVTGPWRLSRAVLPAMRARGGGQILQISSVGGVGTMPLLGAYNTAKWGLEAMGEALAAEVADQGIRVRIVEPGAIDTAWGTTSMRFAEPHADYDALRTRLFGTAEVPWGAEGTGGGAAPEDLAARLLDLVETAEDPRLRILLGEDAPAQVAQAMAARIADYRRDARYASVDAGRPA